MSEVEQRARIALLEHSTSQRQGYRIHILTTIIALVGLGELWARLPASGATYFLMSFLLGTFAYFLVWLYFRGLWYGALAWRALSARPIDITGISPPGLNCSTLLYRISQGQAETIRNKDWWHWDTSGRGRRLDYYLHELSRQFILLGYRTNNLQLVSLVAFAVVFSLAYWTCSSGILLR